MKSSLPLKPSSAQAVSCAVATVKLCVRDIPVAPSVKGCEVLDTAVKSLCTAVSPIATEVA